MRYCLHIYEKQQLYPKGKHVNYLFFSLAARNLLSLGMCVCNIKKRTTCATLIKFNGFINIPTVHCIHVYECYYSRTVAHPEAVGGREDPPTIKDGAPTVQVNPAHWDPPPKPELGGDLAVHVCQPW